MSFITSFLIGAYIGFKLYKAHEKKTESVVIISGNNNKVKM